MTREESIEELERLLRHWDLIDEGIYDLSEHDQDAVEIALTALRPVSRERVEKVWKGEWNQDEHGRVVCSRCGSICAIGTKNTLHNAKKYDRFCFFCGAPMTDEAVDMVMERLEALYDTKN